MIVVAKEINAFGELPEGVSAETVRSVAGMGTAGLGGSFKRYDLADANPIEHWDTGLVEVPRSSVAGRIWHDANYDGIQAKTGDGSYSLAEEAPETTDPENEAYDPDAANKLAMADGSYSSCEEGLEGQTVLLTQWYWVPSGSGTAGRWAQNTAFGRDTRTAAVAGASSVEASDGTVHKAIALGGGVISQLTGADGAYRFNELPVAYMAPDGTHYLAAYRVALRDTVVEDNGTEDTADDVHWLLTRYHAGDDQLMDADLENEDGNHADVGIAIQGREDFADAEGNHHLLTRANKGQVILADVADEVYTAYNQATGKTVKQESQVALPVSEVADGLDELYGANAVLQFDWLTAREGTMGERSRRQLRRAHC